MKRLLLIVISGLFCATGCLDYEEVLKLNADGSGEVRMHVTMEKEFIEQMKLLSEQMGGTGESQFDDFGDFCSEEEIRAALQDMGSSLELIDYVREESDTEVGFRLAFRFESQADFRDLVRACPDEDEAEDTEDDLGFSFTYARQGDGRWRFARDFQNLGGRSGAAAGSAEGMDMQNYAGDLSADSADHAMAGMDPEKMAQAMQQMDDVLAQLRKTNPEAARQMEAQMQAMDGSSPSMEQAAEKASQHGLRFEVHFPADVVETNATQTTSRTAVWEYSLDQLQNAPRELEAYIKP